MTTTYTVIFHGETGDDLGSTQIDYATMKALCHAMALFESKVAKHGFVAAWILGGIARQIGFDAKSGALNAKNLFRSWMKQKWQRVPRPVRKVAFGIGVSARAAYRGARHSDRTLSRGVQHGVVEGQHRHREWQELREMQREFPGKRDHPHYAETRERIEADRKDRFFEHQKHAAEVRQAAREKKAAPAPPVAPKPVPPEIPTQPTVSEPLAAPNVSVVNGEIPVHPGNPETQGDWQMVYTPADGVPRVLSGRTREHAEQEAKWWLWRKDKPGGAGGSLAVVPMPDRLSNFRRPDGSLHFGRSADDPTGVADCTQCSGTAAKDGDVCPSCLARSDIRNQDWTTNNPHNLSATNGHVVSSGCSACAHNH